MQYSYDFIEREQHGGGQIENVHYVYRSLQFKSDEARLYKFGVYFQLNRNFTSV